VEEDILEEDILEVNILDGNILDTFWVSAFECSTHIVCLIVDSLVDVERIADGVCWDMAAAKKHELSIESENVFIDTFPYLSEDTNRVAGR
jgi:hypothetical protein